MKILCSILVYLCNLLDTDCEYRLNKIDDTYYIFRHNNNEMYNIASIKIFQILFLYLPIIEVSDVFYTFNEKERKFIIYHELGHYKLKHHLKFVNIHCLDELNLLEQEADEYAMYKVGKEIALKTLNKTRSVLQKFEKDNKYITERIENIELKDEYACE